MDRFDCVFCNSMLLINRPIYNRPVIVYISADLFSISIIQSLAHCNRLCFSLRPKISKIMFLYRCLTYSEVSMSMLPTHADIS